MEEGGGLPSWNAVAVAGTGARDGWFGTRPMISSAIPPGML